MIDVWKKQRQVLESTAATLIQEALRAGAEKAEVCASFSAKTKIGFEKQDFHMASSDDGLNYGLRVLWQNRQGFVSGNSIDKSELKEVAQTAVRIAKVSPANELNTMATSENVRKEAPTEFWDDAIVDLSLSTQREWAKAFVAESIKDARFRLNEGALAVEGSLFLVSNSLGTHKIHQESACTWSLMGMATEGEKITSFDYFSDLARTMAGLPDRIVQSAIRFREKTLAQLKTGPAKSYRGAVVFSPRAVLDVLARPVLYHLNGRQIVEGSTKWKVEHKGQVVVDPRVHIYDMPWNLARFGASVFDREGTPTSNRGLIEQGAIAGFLLDQYSAKALKLASTGNAVGGPAALPSAGAHSVLVKTGDLDLASWMKSAGEGVLFVNRFSGRTDPVTGDFSGVAKGAEWCENGERKYFVQDTLISGNLFDTLSKNLLGIDRVSEAVDASGDSPALVADGVSVTSGGK